MADCIWPCTRQVLNAWYNSSSISVLISKFHVEAGLLLAVPYGVMADRHGRKVVLVLCILGIALGHVYYAVVCKAILTRVNSYVVHAADIEICKVGGLVYSQSD